MAARRPSSPVVFLRLSSLLAKIIYLLFGGADGTRILLSIDISSTTKCSFRLFSYSSSWKKPIASLTGSSNDFQQRASFWNSEIITICGRFCFPDQRNKKFRLELPGFCTVSELQCIMLVVVRSIEPSFPYVFRYAFIIPQLTRSFGAPSECDGWPAMHSRKERF